MISVILLNYQRPHNMARIIASIKAQTVPTEITLFNNRPDCQWGEHKPDRVITSDTNLGCYARLLMAHYAKYDYIVTMDDDVAISDPQLFEYLLAHHQPGSILGAHGRNVNFANDNPYSSQPDVTNGACNVIKGVFMFYPKALLNQVPIGDHTDNLDDDIHISLSTGGGKAIHQVDLGVRIHLIELETQPSGVSAQPGHYERRDEFCREWARRHNATN